MTLKSEERFRETTKKLNVISPSMCIAKWNQVTIHLGTGTTHSCHHPAPHKIPLDELAENPSALHNTRAKKEIRKMMLEGKRPAECDFCWRVEDCNSEDDIYSDRITKSSEEWAHPYLEKIKQLPWDADVTPTYLEIDFDTTCNFKCAYCTPSYSTTWMQEVKTHGPYRLENETLHDPTWLESNKILPILQSEYNPYIEAFWKWFPTIISNLHTFRITGGEPLLSKHTFKILDFLIENPQPNLEFNINSNLGVPDALIDKFIEKMQIIQEKKCVRIFKLYTSNEAHGEHAEYIRFGLNYTKWYSNCNRILSEIPYSYLTVMSAFNIMSIFSFKKMMEDVVTLKQKYTIKEGPTQRLHPVSLDVPFVRWPAFLAPWVAPIEFLPLVEECVTYAYQNIEQMNWLPLFDSGFHHYEVNRLQRLYEAIKHQMIDWEKDTEHRDLLRRQFFQYITEYDKRRGTDFYKTFPEYKNFMKTIEESMKT
jgi:organic radical activating enzyme